MNLWASRASFLTSQGGVLQSHFTDGKPFLGRAEGLFALHILNLSLLAAHHSGTIFLWIFWPSFNSALTSLGDTQHRTALNTYYSLTASTLSTFALSALVSGDGRLNMVCGRALGRQRDSLAEESLRLCTEASREYALGYVDRNRRRQYESRKVRG